MRSPWPSWANIERRTRDHAHGISPCRIRTLATAHRAAGIAGGGFGVATFGAISLLTPPVLQKVSL